MPPIEHPGFDYPYELDGELEAIRDHQEHRGIPAKGPSNCLIASWNLCNLGDEGQQRSDSDLAIMAEMLKPFDLIAVQEIKDDFRQFRTIVSLMGPGFDYMITDRAGNDERLGFVYDVNRVKRRQLVGELVILKHERQSVTIEYAGEPTEARLTGYSRNPYLAAFQTDDFLFTLANVHILFGSGKRDFLRRVAEVYNLAYWAHDRVTNNAPKTFDHDIILIGDFNIPKAATTDRVGRELIEFGMQLTSYGTATGSNLSEDKQYDQIAFHPAHTQNRYTGNGGVFDFDKAVFNYFWNNYEMDDFTQFVKYHISDHRLIWSEWNSTPN